MDVYIDDVNVVLRGVVGKLRVTGPAAIRDLKDTFEDEVGA